MLHCPHCVFQTCMQKIENFLSQPWQSEQLHVSHAARVESALSVLHFREEDIFEPDENDMNGVVNEVIDEAKLGVFANRNWFDKAF